MKKLIKSNQIKLVPVFAARWRAICKYFINSDKTQPRRTRKKDQNARRNHSSILKQQTPRLNSKRTKAKGPTFQVT